MRKSLPLLVLLAACGNIDNVGAIQEGVRREDASFLRAVPTAADVAVDAPSDPASQGLTARVDALSREICQGKQAVEIFCNGHAQAAGLNAMTAQLLGIVDAVRATTPTERRHDVRIWEAADDKNPGMSWRVEVHRLGSRDEGNLHFEWTVGIQTAPGDDFVIPLFGEFTPGPGGTAKGKGELTWDGKVSREQLADPNAHDLNRLIIGYDLLSSSRTIDATFVAANEDGTDGTEVQFTSVREARGAGSWHYRMAIDIDSNGVPDTLDVKARWDDKQAGRADAKLSVGESDYFVRECWSRFLQRLYFEMPNFTGTCPRDVPADGGSCTFGRESLCVFDDLYGG